MVKYKFVQMTTTEDGSKLIVVQRVSEPNRFARLLGMRPTTKTLRFLGSGIYWDQLPDFTDPGHHVRNVLYRFQNKSENANLL